jgi:signal transduction histidine kinase
MSIQAEAHTRLHGRWLLVARLAWIAIAILTTMMHMVALPVAFNLLRTPCYQEPCDTPFQTPFGTESAVQGEASLRGAWQSTIWEIIVWLVPLGVALLIVWRRSDDWMAHLASIMLVTFIAISPWPQILADAQPLWYWPRALLWAVGLASTVGLLYLFPDGHFVPRWTRRLAIVFLVIIVVLAAAGAPFLTGFPIFVVTLVTGTVFQIYRYRHVSEPIQRQQTKWVVLGIIGMALPMLVVFIVAFLNPSWNPLLRSEPRSLHDSAIFGNMVTAGLIIPFCFLPVTLAFSMLRYRLWDVDILINRTLVYGALTASVVGLYVLLVGGLSRWLSTGLQAQNYLPASVIAILALAFLFQPLRQRLQGIMNHFVPIPQSALPLEQHGYTKAIREGQAIGDTALRVPWLFTARLVWVAAFITLATMYALGFLAVHDRLSTVCEEEPCTLREQIRHTDAGEQVMDWGGPPEGYADPLRPDQVRVLEPLGLTLDEYGWLGALQLGIPALMYLLIAAGLFWWKSDDWMVLFASTMVATFPFVDMPLPNTLVVRQPVWEWVHTPLNFVAVSCFFIFPLIFPTGQVVPRWTRWKLFSDIAFAIIGTLVRDSILRPPPGWSAFVFPYIILSFVINAYAQSYRYFRVASLVERQQIKWVVVGVVGFITIALPVDRYLYYHPVIIGSAQALVTSAIPDTLYRVITLFIPVSIAISVLRYRLWDIDVIINRTLVYGALTGIVVVAFVIIVGFLSVIFQASGNSIITIIATGLVALVFNPLRQRLQRSVNHLMYGERDDPYAALARLGRQLETSLAPEAVLPTVVTTVREVLKLPYVAIYLKHEDGNKIAAESASLAMRSESGRIVVPGIDREGLCIPLIYQGETLGYIVLGPRAPHEAFSATDLRLLGDLAPQVGVAVHAVRLTADLQHAREQLVLAREEERRRFRRDLHDDLAPTLASLGLSASTVADLISINPAKATLLAKELQTEIRATVGNIRKLVYDLRPPTLDELGLLAAIRERAAQYSNAPNGFRVTVDAPSELPALPAAAEVAAYRIVQEALENVSKHAQARQCSIRFTNHKGLEIEIIDDGIGIPSIITPGVGLRSMRERADELGGSCVIELCTSGGTRILAHLPIGEYNGIITHPDRG